MLSYRTPGVYFERPAARPALRRGATDVAGFVGVARCGPLHHPVRLGGWPEFTAVFGGHTSQGYLAYAAEGFFANGGRACWVVRVADPATAAVAALDLHAGGAPVGRLVAANPGRWGDQLEVTAVGTAAGRFTLLLRAPGGGEEVWRDLSVFQDDPRWLPRVLNRREGGSRLVRHCTISKTASRTASRTATGPPPPAVLELVEGRSNSARPVGGEDGLASLTADHFLTRGPVPDPEDPCAPPRSDRPWGVAALAEVDEVSLVAVPDAVARPLVKPPPHRPRPVDCERLCSTSEPAPAPEPEAAEQPPALAPGEVARLHQGLLAHCELLGDRVAVLDVPPAAAGGGDRPDGVLTWRRNFNSRWGAAYWPWPLVPERLPGPRSRGELLARVPPSGHVAGAIAASDLRRGVHKPPANDPLVGIDDLAFPLDDVAHGRLNEAGVNALRVLPGRGIRVAGARTLDPDPLHRYLNVRRLLLFIVETLDEGTQWAVFEPHHHRLREQVDRVVRAFLLGLWRDGMLDGRRAEDAFRVTCDESVNPPSEVEAGRLVCEIAVRPPWPAELVVARIAVGEGGVELLEGAAAGGGDA